MRSFVFAFALVAAFGAQAVEVAGVRFEDKTQLAPNTQELVLNGAGLRTKFFVKVYAGGLYLPQTNRNAAEIVAMPGPKRVQLVMLRDVTAKQFGDAFKEGLEDNISAEELQRIKPQTDQLFALIEQIGELKKTGIVRLDYVPESGTRIQVNGESKGAPIPGGELYRALLRIWLGDKPVDADLKAGMVGG